MLGDLAYPEDIQPLARPRWLRFAMIGGLLFGSLLIGSGILRILIFGGLLGGAAISAKKAMD